MQKIKKAVIPAAGLGTRFFPATKTVPKEMLPIVDRPTILYVIEEAIQAGVEDVILIQGRGKTAIEDFFDVSYELEDKLIRDGKGHLLDSINYIRERANIISVRQKTALGLGHAVYTAKKVVGDSPFVVLLGDEISCPRTKNENSTYMLGQLYEQTQVSAVAVMEVSSKDVHKYGVIDFELDEQKRIKVTGLVEKPHASVAPSLFAMPGRYAFSPKIFEILEHAKPGHNGEIQLTDSMSQLAKEHGLYALLAKAPRYDAGDKVDYLRANIELALQRDDMRGAVEKMLRELIMKGAVSPSSLASAEL